MKGQTQDWKDWGPDCNQTLPLLLAMTDQQKLELNILLPMSTGEYMPNVLLEGDLSGPEPFSYNGRQSHLENDALLVQGSHRST